MKTPGYKILIGITILCMIGLSIKLLFFKASPDPKSHISFSPEFARQMENTRAQQIEFTRQLERSKALEEEERNRPIKALHGDENAQRTLCQADNFNRSSLLWCRYLDDGANDIAANELKQAEGKYSSGIRSYLEADANHGDVASQYEVGLGYYLGLDEFPLDLESAYFWLTLALKNTPKNYFWHSYGDKRPYLDREYFTFWRDDAAHKITPEKIETENKRIEEWDPTTPPPAIAEDDAVLKLAEEGDGHSEWTIALIYEKACCGKKDYVQATFWQRVAREYAGVLDLRGDTGEYVDYPERHLSPGQMEIVDKKVKEWNPSNLTSLKNRAEAGHYSAFYKLGKLAMMHRDAEEAYFQFSLDMKHGGNYGNTPSEYSKAEKLLTAAQIETVKRRVQEWDETHPDLVNLP